MKRLSRSPEGQGLSDLAYLRQAAYRLFSAMLLYPNEARLKTVAATAAELQRYRQAMTSFPIYPQWERMLGSLATLAEGQAREMEIEFVRLFRHHPDGTPCLPYESVYVDPWRQAGGWVTSAVEREYAAAGLSLSPSLKDLPDHAAVELEFMAFLCQQEAKAWEREDLPQGIQALERQASFLRRHLGRWLPQWARELEDTAGNGVYPVVAATTGAFIGQDQDLVDVLLHRLRGLAGADKSTPGHQEPLRSGPRAS